MRSGIERSWRFTKSKDTPTSSLNSPVVLAKNTKNLLLWICGRFWNYWFELKQYNFQWVFLISNTLFLLYLKPTICMHRTFLLHIIYPLLCLENKPRNIRNMSKSCVCCRMKRTCSWWWTCSWEGTSATTCSRTSSSTRPESSCTYVRLP